MTAYLFRHKIYAVEDLIAIIRLSAVSKDQYIDYD